MVIVESREEGEESKGLTMEKIESGRVVEDVEEGEISDSASVEEITEEDFRKQDFSSNPKPSIGSPAAKGGDPRVYTAQDLYKYPGFRNNWYNLAWAHGVHNKPFFANPKPEPASSANVVIDDSDDEAEKEDGELEEGEIDLDAEPSPKPKPVAAAEVERDGGVVEIDSDDSYREILGSVSVDDSEKSFEEVCSRIQHTLESLREAVSEGKSDGVEEILFNAVQTVNYVFCTMTQNQKELKKEALSRLLSSITSSEPSLVSPEHLIQIELMKAPLNSSSDSDLITPNADSNGHHHEHHHEQTSVKWPSVSSVINNNNNNINNSNPTPAFKSMGRLLPLLDLHKDHDEDSLPSPTRDAPPSSFPVTKPLGISKEDSRLLRYETDAFKAVSTYQQKFGRNSFMMTDMLPSPTPSEEESDGSGGDDDDDDTNMEISSSLGAPILNPPSVSVPPAINVVTSSSTLSQPPAPAKALARSRDPRLRFANPDPGSVVLDLNHTPLNKLEPPIESMSSRKQRGDSEMNLDGPIMKRQRNAFESTGIVGDNVITRLTNKKVQLMGNSEADPRRSVLPMANFVPTNGLTVGAEQVPMTSTINSLPELLKDITGNPEILLNILKGQQQKLAHLSSDPANDATAQPLTPNLIPQSKPSGVIQPLGNLSLTSKRSQDDTGTIRMKPRDPRRVLHGSGSLQKAGNLPKELLKTNAGPITLNKDSLNGQKIQEVQKVVEPDIARQFTKSLRNIANIMSVSAPTSQNPSSQVKTDRGVLKGVTPNNEDQMGGAIPNSEKTVLVPPRVSAAWGDVEHLFEGYDDRQKLAIQRERERRLEEQKKMFEARKLSLVLDLDHTLLNSAKFVEVDIVHDEILRKKEEQDREKPHRHLYRLPHMGMWTKLRPGIWNFLEKASKLFEMHLYTMGNNFYATEMAKILDPDGTLFSGRVIARGDDGDLLDGDDRVPKTKDLEGVMGMESAVVIIDDSVRVWPHNKLNLIAVERYTYFPCSRLQFGLPGPSLLEIDHDERPEAGTLASSLGVIEKIHQNFFSHKSLDEADVRNILASEQLKILAGCRIVFSRVFPVSEVKPHLHPLWQTAQQFGATCTTQIDDQVTHVVANSAGTDKVNWAIANGKFAVHPGWVEASALLYRRANEQDFTIKPTPPS